MEGGTYQMQNGAMAGLGLIGWLIILGVYLFFAYCHYRVAQKAGCQSTAWYAYVPLMNIILMCQMARKPAWWFVFFLIPFVNVIVMAYLWAETAKYIGQPSFWGWLMLLPVVNMISTSLSSDQAASAFMIAGCSSGQTARRTTSTPCVRRTSSSLGPEASGRIP